MTQAIEIAWDLRCGIAESCVWDARNRRVLFCDSPGGRILAYGIDDGSQRAWTFPERVGSFGLCESGKLVVALFHKLVMFDPATGASRDLAGPIDEAPTSKLNDGKVGPDGCFWVGTMDLSPAKQPVGHLYRVTPDGRIEHKAEGYIVSNGLAWSPDGKTMYHSDSQRYFIDAWDFAPTGDISNKRRFADLKEVDGKPDGAATDSEGFLWSAGCYGGVINRFSPDGKIVEKIVTPFPTPTMVCFADDWMYITTLRAHCDAETQARYPQIGGLFRMKAPAVGAPVAKFNDL